MAIEWDHCIDELHSLAANSDSVKLSRYGKLQFDGQFNSIFTRMLDTFTDNSMKERRIPMLIKLLDRHCFDVLTTATANIQARYAQGLCALAARSIAARLHASITCIDGLVKQGLQPDRSCDPRVVRYVLDSISQADGIILEDAREQFANGCGGADGEDSFYHLAITALSVWRDRACYTISRPLIPSYDPSEWDRLISKLDILTTNADAVHIDASGKFIISRAVMDVIDDMVKLTTCTRRLVSAHHVTELLDALVATNCMNTLHRFTKEYSEKWRECGEAGAGILIVTDPARGLIQLGTPVLGANTARGISIRLHAFSSCVCALAKEGSREWGEMCNAYLEGHVDQASIMLVKFTAGEIGHFGEVDRDCQADDCSALAREMDRACQAYDCSALAIASLRKWRDMLRFVIARSAVKEDDRNPFERDLNDFGASSHSSS